MSLTNISKAIALMGGLYSLGVVLIKGDHSSLFLIFLGLIFGAWVVAPFALAWWRAPRFEESIAAGTVLLIATSAATAFSLWAYWVTFIDNPTPDAQDGLIFLFVPLYQLLGMAFGLWTAGWVARLAK